jgi:hypothetical protein
MEGLTQAITTGALSVLVRPLGWSATHPILIPADVTRVSHLRDFLGLVSGTTMDNDVPLVYEAYVTSVISRRTFEVYRLYSFRL